MGDGHVALILDVAGLGRLGDLSLSIAREQVQVAKEAEAGSGQEKLSLFVFRNTPQEHCAVPLDLVARVELIDAGEIEEVGGRRVIKYRGGTLPVFSLDQATNVNLLDISGELIVIVFLMAGHEIGLLAKPPVDAIGLVAWKMLDADPERFDLVVTDIEMPNMDGFELSRRIRQDKRFSLMPIIALTSLAGDEDVARGKAVGIDDYQVKLDKERLLQSIYEWLRRYAS